MMLAYCFVPQVADLESSLYSDLRHLVLLSFASLAALKSSWWHRRYRSFWLKWQVLSWCFNFWNIAFFTKSWDVWWWYKVRDHNLWDQLDLQWGRLLVSLLLLWTSSWHSVWMII